MRAQVFEVCTPQYAPEGANVELPTPDTRWKLPLPSVFPYG